MSSEAQRPRPTGEKGLTLVRELGLLALVATAVCNVIGGGINMLSVSIQGKIPGIGAYVPLAFFVGVFPALFTALCYATLSSAMPRAGGGYIYVSRGLNPFLGFMATFSKWFGLSSVIGVIAYMDVALLQSGVGYLTPYVDVGPIFAFLSSGAAKLVVPLGMIWLFWLLNVLGVRTYGWTVIVLMTLMLLGGLAVIIVGFSNGHEDFAAALASNPGPAMSENLQRVGLAGKSAAEISATAKVAPFEALNFLKASAFLFFAYIGFASISQAGGETRNPRRSLPWAFVAATTVICTYYLLFSSAVYHAIPWRFIAGFTQAAPADVSVPLLIGALMPPALASFVALMAGMALANDIPPMLMATSRLFFAWARDGVFPRGLASISQRFRTPHWALTTCALVATLWVILCNIEEDYFAGVDTVVMALTFTYVLICVSVLSLPRHNPDIYRNVSFLRSRPVQIFVSCVGLAFLCPLIVLAVLVADTKSLIFWLAALATGALIYAIMWFRARARGENLREVFAQLPTASEQLEVAPELKVED